MNIFMNQGFGLWSTSRLEPPFRLTNTFCSGDSALSLAFVYCSINVKQMNDASQMFSQKTSLLKQSIFLF